MAKRQRSISLSFVLLRFAAVMLGCMLLCAAAWLILSSWLEDVGVVYHGSVSNQQVERLLAEETETFTAPSEDFLASYALFGPDGEVLQANVSGGALQELAVWYRKDAHDLHLARRAYADGSCVLIRWDYRKEFVNPVLRSMLPPFEYLWWGVLGALCALCLLFNTLWLRRRLADKLELFSEVSQKVGAQQLDFTVPRAGIREYDQALEAMDQMRQALYSALSAQWAAQQAREAEIGALAHDLKTPLTLIGGNAELLLDEELPGRSRRMAETIKASSDRAKHYVAGLLEAAAGEEEPFEECSLPALFQEVCCSAAASAESKGVRLQSKNGLQGMACAQKGRLVRAIGNAVQNAIEHTPPGRCVWIEGRMEPDAWVVTVRDEGPGFSRAALRHGSERLWRGDAARAADGHNGLGLWFAAQVAGAHAGRLELGNSGRGGVVVFRFDREETRDR